MCPGSEISSVLQRMTSTDEGQGGGWGCGIRNILYPLRKISHAALSDAMPDLAVGTHMCNSLFALTYTFKTLLF